MATHSSILVWRIPWTEESDGLQSIGSNRDKTEATSCMHIQERYIRYVKYTDL